jgi:ankyrin repeat protein
MIKTEIFSFIKENNFKKVEELLINENNENNKNSYDIHDENYNFLIHYLVIFNQIKLIKFLLERNIRLDVLDIDGRTILYYPIKFNYFDLFDILLEYNKKVIGISIIDIKDKLGNTALHYATILNNLIFVKKLISNNADPLIKNNDYDNILQIALKYNRNDIINYIVNENYNINFLTITGENFLQLSITYQNIAIINLLIENTNINLNNQEKEYGTTALQQLIVQNNISLCKKIINKSVNINQQDYYGNSPLIYISSENNNELFDLFLSLNNLNYNLTNIDGKTSLHIILSTKPKILKKYIEKIMINTDLNIQNNLGKTCLHLLIENNIFLDYYDILINKELNIFINDINGITVYDLIQKNENKNKLFELIINSYYNFLLIKKNILKVDWEIWCGNNITEKIKTLNKCKNNIEICKEKIKDIIFIEKRSIPVINDINLIIDNGVFVDTCFYTGSTIDILFGLIFLYETYSISGLNLLINYPLTKNELLLSYYKSIGLDLNYKLDFINFEILWSFQKIFFPIDFENNMLKLIKKNKYIVIPIGIETSKGSHANILFFDVKNKILERFEPNGANEPKDFNFNSILLDKLILNKFLKIDDKIKYIVPSLYLPVIGFQIIENLNENKCKRIGDPNGFCGIWCIWWIYQRIKHINIEPIKLVNELIKEFKLKNINFKNYIRNFSKNITDIRDTYLKKYNLDINDWIVGNYDDNILDDLDRNICKRYSI